MDVSVLCAEVIPGIFDSSPGGKSSVSNLVIEVGEVISVFATADSLNCVEVTPEDVSEANKLIYREVVSFSEFGHF